jgi:hypothetical protein
MLPLEGGEAVPQVVVVEDDLWQFRPLLEEEEPQLLAKEATAEDKAAGGGQKSEVVRKRNNAEMVNHILKNFGNLDRLGLLRKKFVKFDKKNKLNYRK